MKLGIIGAMQLEVELLLQRMQNHVERSVAGSIFYEGDLEGLPVVVVQCGVGKVNAALCVQILCDVFCVTHLVNTGIAGSLHNDLDIGDFVISSDAMYHDFDCTVFGYSYGQVPAMPQTFPADEMLTQQAMQAAAALQVGQAHIGRIASGDQFVANASQKNAIIASTGALCTEMEGAAIAHAAFRNQVPFVILRAISDKADNSAEMDYPTFEKAAANHCAQLVCCLAKQLA